MSRHHSIAILLVLLHALLATAFSIGNPLGEAPDETDHWAYAVYLARERSLPEGPRVTQSKHPPFYHASTAAVASLATPHFGFLRANPDIAIHPSPTQSPNFFIHTTLEDWPWREGVLAFHLGRLWSVFLSSATVAAIYALARRALPKHPNVALLATGLAAALPEFAFIGGSVSNDNAAALFSTLALWGGFTLYRCNGVWQSGWWTPIALGCGLLAKVSTIALWPVIGMCILLGTARGPSNTSIASADNVDWRALLHHWRRWLISGLVIFLPALAVAVPWLLRNWRLYGDLTGMTLVQQTIDLRTTPWTWPDTLWLLQGWFLSFWGKFGAVGHIPYPSWTYWLLGLVSLVGISGIGLGCRTRPARLPILLLILAVLLVALSMWQYSLIALGTDQGRLLFPAIGPLLLLLAFGLASWPWEKVRTGLGRALASMLIAALTLLALYGLLGVIRPAFAPPPPPSPDALATAEASRPMTFGELTLHAWTLQSDPILFWHAPARPTQDWRINLRVTAEDGTLVWEWRRSPGYGRFSTDHWTAGTILRDAYAVQWPEWAGPGRYRVEVTTYPFGGEPGEVYPFALVGWLERE